MKRIAKKKGKKVAKETEVLKETLTIRVTRSQVKHLQLDSGDQGNTETLAASSLIKLSTFKVRDMSVLAIGKSVASSTITRSVTRSITQRLPQSVTIHPLPISI